MYALAHPYKNQIKLIGKYKKNQLHQLKKLIQFRETVWSTNSPSDLV